MTVFQLPYQYIIMAQRTKTQLYCKNHQQQLGTFFLSEQPWIKFCSECALNMALCGKKIDKDLTAQQYDNKTQVLSIRQRMKDTLNRFEPSKKTLQEITTRIQAASQSQISTYIKNFDLYVRSLCEIRDQVVHIFEEGFQQNIQAYFEKQTKMLLFQIKLKENLQYIQANFRRIIETKEQSFITHKVQEWSNLITEIDRILPSETEVDDVEQMMIDKMNMLHTKLSSIQPFKIAVTENYKKRTIESKITEAPGSYESVNLSQKKENSRKTQLKLRSRSKKSDKRGERETLKTRKSIRDISNFQIMESFHI